MGSLNKYYTKALIAAVVINVLFFILIGWAFFHRSHHSVIKQPTKLPAIKTTITPNKSTNNKENALPALIANTFNHKVTIAKTFAAPGGLQGLVLKMKGSNTSNFIAYYNASLKQLYLGSVINAQGLNTTIKDTQQYLSDPLKPVIYKAVQHLKAVTTGPQHYKHQLTIIIDPNAPLFKPLFENMLEENKDFALQVRWVLVNYLKPMGPNLAGWVYAGINPSKRLVMIANSKANDLVRKYYPPLSKDIINILRSNWNVMQSYHLVPGPVTTFKTTNDFYVLKGLVDFESLEQVLPNMAS